MGSSPEVVPSRLIVDSVHGDLHLTAREWRILDTMPFQRLRNLKHLGMAHLTFPSATHTRFAHSLGTLGVMARILKAAEDNSYHLTQEQQENLRMAALLHDIGHYPYSHLMDSVERTILTEEVVDSGESVPRASKPLDATRVGYPSHEILGMEIVNGDEELVEAIGGTNRAQEVADLFGRRQAADPQLSKLLHSSFDMDRVDYLRRDSQAVGVPYGDIDINYLLNSLQISPTGMVGVSEKALPAAEHFLMARFFMHRVVYYHKTTFGFEEACRHLIRRLRDDGMSEVPADGNAILKIVRSPDLAGFTDSYVDNLVGMASQQANGVSRVLARSIQHRRPPKLLKEVPVLQESDKRHDAGTTFWLNAKRCLPDLARRFSIPLGQFLLCQTQPFKIEKRGARLTAEQARSMPPEQQDETIKVFIGGGQEPVSLVDVPHSLIYLCAGHVFRANRLYVVCENRIQEAAVDAMKEAVRGWDGTE